MEFTYAQICSQGPVRSNNEDYVGCWQPKEVEEQRNRGAVVAIADGVGGQGHGELASRLAVEAAIARFQELSNRTRPGGLQPKQACWRMFTAMPTWRSTITSMDQRDQGRMATTLTVSLFRNNEVTIGHVGDCRVYLIHRRACQTDYDRPFLCRHAIAAGPDFAARGGHQRHAVRAHPQHRQRPHRPGRLLHDPSQPGRLSGAMFRRPAQLRAPEEFGEIVTHASPDGRLPRACGDLAVKRGTDDNLSVQIVRIDRVEDVMYLSRIAHLSVSASCRK
jgi:hypothetical protein